MLKDAKTRIIKQVIASTGVDIHGDQLSEEALRTFLSQMPDVSPIYLNHDLTKPPVARSFNPRIELLDGGNHGLVVDVEIFDEDAFSQCGGASVSYVGARRVVMTLDRDPDLMIAIPDRLWSGSLAGRICRLSESDCLIEVANVKRKSAVEIVVAVIAFASLEMAKGFFSEIGSTAYRVIRNAIKQIVSVSAERETQAAFEVRFNITISDQEMEVILTVPVTALKCLDAPLDFDILEKRLCQLIGRSEIVKIGIELENEHPHWGFRYFVTNDGLVTQL